MKVKKLISVLMMFAMMITATSVFCQQEMRVEVPKGKNAYMVGNANGWGLEVNGKLVVPKQYNNFQTDGAATHFAVEAKDGKYGVCDSKGVFIYKCTYYKAQITGDMISLKTSANSEPKFYNTATPTVEKKVTVVDPLSFNSALKNSHLRSIAEAEAIAAKDPLTAFELRETSGGRFQLWVNGSFLYKEYKSIDDKPAAVSVTNGKLLIEATDISILSDYEYYKKKSSCWVFMVDDKKLGLVGSHGKKGILTVYIFADTASGRKMVETFLSVPIDKHWITGMCDDYVSVTEWSGAEYTINVLNGKRVGGGYVLDNCRERKKKEREKEQAAKEFAEAKNETFEKVVNVNFKKDYHNFTITEISLSNLFTRLTLEYKGYSYGGDYKKRSPDGDCFSPFYADIQTNGKTYRMNKQRGLDLDGKTCLKKDETAISYVYYDALPQNLETFDLRGGDWIIENIVIRENKRENNVQNETFDKVIKVNAISKYNNLIIKEIALSKDKTRLTFTYKNEDSRSECYFSEKPGDKNGAAIIADDEYYLMTAQTGLRYKDEGATCLKPNETLTWYVYFDALPENIENFDFTNCATGNSRWDIENISLKKPSLKKKLGGELKKLFNIKE